MQRSVEQLNTWPVLHSQRRGWDVSPDRLRLTPQMSDSGKHRSISEDLKPALPCGRNWRGFSQEISIHKGSCARQRWTGHRLERQDCFYTSSVTLVFKAVCEIRLKWTCCCTAWNWTFSCSQSTTKTLLCLFEWSLWLDSKQTRRHCDHKARISNFEVFNSKISYFTGHFKLHSLSKGFLLNVWSVRIHSSPLLYIYQALWCLNLG